MTTTTTTTETTTYPSSYEAAKFHVVAINPDMGSVATKSFNEGTYRGWNGEVANDGYDMQEFIRYYVKQGYGVVVSAPRFTKTGVLKSNVTIAIDPKWFDCTCGHGIYCPTTNKQTVSFWRDDIDWNGEVK